MQTNPNRRQFLRNTATAGAALGLGEWSALLSFTPSHAAAGAVTPDLVRFSPDTEPIIKLILDTPREKCIATVVEQLRKGRSYRQFLAALYLTAVRVGPWHSNAFDHVAYSIHSAQQLALDLPPQEMLLPTLWALDCLKAGSPKPAVWPVLIPGPLASAERAQSELRAGVENRDEERAVKAIIGMSRALGPNQVSEALWEFAARDWTFIGHLAILTANSWRLLQTIGWQHAEPVLGYVVSGLTGAKDSRPDLQYFAENEARVDKSWKTLPAAWSADDGDGAFTRDLLVLLRELKSDQACDMAVARLVAGKSRAGAVWDAVFLAAGEMISCAQKNSTPLHANTVANALRFAFGHSGQPRTRLLILLQAVAWMVRFRTSMANSGWLREPKDIVALTAAELSGRPESVVTEILSNLSHGGTDHGPANVSAVPGWHGPAFNSQPWRHAAACQVFALAQNDDGTDALFRAAARLLPAKADSDAHRIKFATAMFENYRWVSPQWRPTLAAAASYSFLGADAPDTATIRQIREALGKR